MATIYANTYLNIAATCSRTSDDSCFKPRWMEAIVTDQVWSCPVKDIKIEGIHEGRPFEIFAPALAGLASRFKDQTTGRYFGGTWQNDLVRILL
jgi:hypothetical protein